MKNIIEIENYLLSVKLNFLNLDIEGYCVKNIYLTDYLYVFTHDKECLLDLVNKQFYQVENSRIKSIAITISERHVELINDCMEWSPCLKSVREIFDILHNYA
jgi:hypothetical protein